MFVRFNTLPYSGGFIEQDVTFVQFAYIAMGEESKANRKWIKKKDR